MLCYHGLGLTVSLLAGGSPQFPEIKLSSDHGKEMSIQLDSHFVWYNFPTILHCPRKKKRKYISIGGKRKSTCNVINFYFW